jgi:type IV secretion system protein VirD4
VSVPIIPLGALAVAVLLGFIGRDGKVPERSTHAARWASWFELRSLRSDRPRFSVHIPSRTRAHRSGRLALGYRGRRLLRAEARHALIAFGPPQSGKSAGLAIPSLLEWDGPAVASSIKTDLIGSTLQHRVGIGEALVYDPFGLSGVASHNWSPLSVVTDWDGALEVAWRLASAAEMDQRGVEGGDFWAVAAEQRLAPLLYAAARSGAGIEQLVAWAYGQRARTLDTTLEQLGSHARSEQEQSDVSAAFEAVQAFRAQADRTRTSIEATVQTLLRAYRFRRVIRSAGGSEITAERLLRRKSTLYLVGDAKASKLLRPLFIALLSEIVDHAYGLANRQGGRLRLPLLLCLDEAGNVAPLPNLAEVASTAPSHNIQLISIFHDLAQARSRYRGQAETLVNSHRARILLPGVADLETLRYFSGLTGEQEVMDFTHTSGRGGTSRSTARRRTPLVSPEALRQLPAGQALLIYGRLAPVKVRLRFWFRDKRLRHLGGGRLPTNLEPLKTRR